jgi:hypothetical protein
MAAAAGSWGYAPEQKRMQKQAASYKKAADLA